MRIEFIIALPIATSAACDCGDGLQTVYVICFYILVYDGFPPAGDEEISSKSKPEAQVLVEQVMMMPATKVSTIMLPAGSCAKAGT